MAPGQNLEERPDRQNLREIGLGKKMSTPKMSIPKKFQVTMKKLNSLDMHSAIAKEMTELGLNYGQVENLVSNIARTFLTHKKSPGDIHIQKQLLECWGRLAEALLDGPRAELFLAVPKPLTISLYAKLIETEAKYRSVEIREGLAVPLIQTSKDHYGKIPQSEHILFNRFASQSGITKFEINLVNEPAAHLEITDCIRTGRRFDFCIPGLRTARGCLASAGYQKIISLSCPPAAPQSPMEAHMEIMTERDQLLENLEVQQCASLFNTFITFVMEGDLS
jgi:hypothetical protein